MAERVEVSVVIPCLNEADTLAICIQKAREGLAAGKIEGEIIVADNGSTDGRGRSPLTSARSSPRWESADTAAR